MKKKQLVLAGPLLVAALGIAPGLSQAASFDTEVLRSTKQVNAGVTYLRFDSPAACNDARTFETMRFRPTGAPTKRCLVETARDGTDTELHCDGGAVPNSTGAPSQARKLMDVSANGSCGVGFTAKLTAGGSGAYVRPDGGPTVDVLLTGDAFPAIGDPTLGVREFIATDINDAGDLSGLVKLVDAVAVPNTSTLEAIFRCTNPANCRNPAIGPELVVQQEDVATAPGISAAGLQICEFGKTLDSSNTGVAFTARVVNLDTPFTCFGANATSNRTTGVFKTKFGAQTELVALIGEAPPGLPAGTEYKRFSSGPEIDNASAVAFLGRTIGAIAKQFVFYCDDGADCAPEVGEGAFGGGSVIKRLTRIDMADATGEVGIQALSGLFSWDHLLLTLSKVVAKGDTFIPGDGGPFTFKRADKGVSASSDGFWVTGRGNVRGQTKPKGRRAIMLGEKQ